MLLAFPYIRLYFAILAIYAHPYVYTFHVWYSNAEIYERMKNTYNVLRWRFVHVGIDPPSFRTNNFKFAIAIHVLCRARMFMKQSNIVRATTKRSTRQCSLPFIVSYRLHIDVLHGNFNDNADLFVSPILCFVMAEVMKFVENTSNVLIIVLYRRL